MTIFVAGIHGVGKTFLAKPVAQLLGMDYVAASQLIREERGRQTWSNAKFVDEIERNQAALIAAVSRRRDAGAKLLLDGHFVLRTDVGIHEQIPEPVFRGLQLEGILLLQCSPRVVVDRLSRRGDASWGIDEIVQFDRAERAHAESIAESLGIGISVLFEPSLEEFSAVIQSVRRWR